MHFGKQIIGVEGGNVNPELDFKRYANYFREKKYRPKKLITKIYSLEDVNKAINHMVLNKTKGRLILKC